MTEKKPLTRSEREAKIKDKAGFVISIFAAILALNTYLSGKLSSQILNNTIVANDIWNFYQAKSVKQTIYEVARDQSVDPSIKKQYEETIARYESDPKTGEGKKELYQQAKNLEDERELAKRKSPWISYAGSTMQMAIVLISASIVAVSAALFWSSFGVMAAGILLMLQGIFLWF
jgi:hypothetical protein